MGPASSTVLGREAANSSIEVGRPSSLALARVFSIGSGSMWVCSSEDAVASGFSPPPQPVTVRNAASNGIQKDFTYKL